MPDLTVEVTGGKWPEEYDVPQWFQRYIAWLAEGPRTVVESWIELEGYGDTCGDGEYDILEIMWEQSDVTTMPWRTSGIS